jgi:hypothetical protein
MPFTDAFTSGLACHLRTAVIYLSDVFYETKVLPLPFGHDRLLVTLLLGHTAGWTHPQSRVSLQSLA